MEDKKRKERERERVREGEGGERINPQIYG